MSAELPNTINTPKPDFILRDENERGGSISVLMTNRQFIELVNSEELKTVFRCIKENVNDDEEYDEEEVQKVGFVYFYVVKEGFCFYTFGFNLKDYEEFFNAQQSAEQKGFTNLIDFLKTKVIGTENQVLFSEFCKSNFYYSEYESSIEMLEMGRYLKNNSKNFKEFRDAKERGFNEEEDYRLANILGNINNELYNKFINSKFSRNFDEYDVLRGSRSEITKYKKAYKEFQRFLMEEKRAQDLGFDTLEHYEDAMRLGFKDATIYSEFLESGCATKDEFKFFKNMPHILETKSEKIREIVNDANDAYKSERYEEFIRLRFLSIEMISKGLYFKTFRKEVENNEDLKVDDIIDTIERELDENLVDYEELKYWRRIRNKIIHEHAKIEKDKAEKGKEFFEELFNKLNKLFSK